MRREDSEAVMELSVERRGANTKEEVVERD